MRSRFRPARTALLGVSLFAVVTSGSALAVATPAAVKFVVPHRTPQRAPVQAFGSAAGRSSRVPGVKANRGVPQTLRSKYPLLEFPQSVKAPANRASLAPAASAPAGATAGIARTSTELPALRGQFRRTFANADGSRTTAFSSIPVNFEAPDGSWQPIDTSLVRQADGSWRNKADRVSVRLAPRGSPSGIATFDVASGVGLSFGLSGAAPSAAAVSAKGATYHGIALDTDLVLAAVPDGLKESIVLRSSRAPRSFTFPLQLRGLTAVASGKSILLRDRAGVTRATIPAGFMVDSAARADGPAYSSAVGYTLSTVGGRQFLRVDLDSRWLSDPGRVFPVTVDPTVQGSTASTGLNVHDTGTTTGATDLSVGLKGGDHWASYLAFPSVSTSLQNETIYGAQLQLVNFDSASCRARAVTVHPVTAAWSSATTTPYPGPAFGSALASQSFAYGFIPFGGSSSPCPAAPSLFNLGTGGRDLIQGWVNGTKANNGLTIRASGSDSLAWKTFAGTSTANAPQLFVTHSPYNAGYAIPNPVPNPPVLKSTPGKVNVVVTNKSAVDWTPTTYKLVYRVFDTKGVRVGQFDAASLTSTVVRGSKVTLNASIAALPVGQYTIDFSMAKIGGPVFTDEAVPPARLLIQVVDIPPVVQEVYPPNGYQAPTLTPQLWARAIDIDATPGSTLTFSFDLCTADANGAPVTTTCTSTAFSSAPAWTIPAGRLTWNKVYVWRASVKDGTTTVLSPYSAILSSVPQPPITSSLASAPYGSQDKDFDPQVGNYTTAALDAPVSTVGAELKVVRSYNSLDPRLDEAFGAGWTSRYDMRLVADNDGSGSVVVTYSDGQTARFGKNPDGTYAAPQGRVASLTFDTLNSLFTLKDSGGWLYTFSSSGRLSKIAAPWSTGETLTYSVTNGKLATVTNVDSGRKLTLSWTGNHVTSVSTDPVNGAALTWNYTYTGDLLTKACAPDNSCTQYGYTTGSHYRTAVLDAKPESYYRLGEDAGTEAGSEIAVNLGKDAATYANVKVADPGALSGTPDTSGTFNGTNSTVSLPNGLVKRSRDRAVELWFKTATLNATQPLLGYQVSALSGTSATGIPALYVGTDGKLRGQFWTGTIAPITSAAAVNNGAWHHVVLSVSGGTQTMYLDGATVGTLTGTLNDLGLNINQVGAAYASATTWPGYGTVAKKFFTGSIDEVAIYAHPLGSEAATTHFALGRTPANELSAITMPSGLSAGSMTYDVGTDRLSEYTDENGGLWKLGRPSVFGGPKDLRRSVRVTDPHGLPMLYEYDGLAGRLVRTGLPNGMPVTGDPLDSMALRSYEYDGNGFVSAVNNELGGRVAMTYDSRGDVITRKNCRTATECYTAYLTYPTGITDPFDPRLNMPTESRDARSTSATDPSFVTRYTYNTKGDILTQTNPDGTAVTHTYTVGGEVSVDNGPTPAGLVKTSTDERGQVTTYAYFKSGDLAQVTEPTGLVTKYTYDALGRRTSMTEISDTFPAGVTTTYTYDGLSRLATETGPVTTDAVTGVKHQSRTAHTYDADGHVLQVAESDLLGNDVTRTTTFTYDDDGRLSTTTDPAGNEVSFGYDEFGNKAFMVDPNGRRIEYTYTSRNQLAETRLRDFDGDPAGVPPSTTGYIVLESYGYDDAGHQVRRTDAMGRTTVTTYTPDDLVAKITLQGFHNPDGTTRDYVLADNTYDGAGNLIKQVGGNGTVTMQFTMDAAGRLKDSVTNPAGVQRRTTYTYDNSGNVVQVDRTGSYSNVPWGAPAVTETTKFAYDVFGRRTSQTVALGTTQFVTGYAYDQRGEMLSTTDPRGMVAGADKAAYTTNFVTDELGRTTTTIAPPVSVESGGGASTTARPTTVLGYNTFGETVESKDADGNVASIAYDGVGRPVTQAAPSYLPPGAATPITPTTRLSYDGVGNLVSSVDARGFTTRYTYDKLNRLQSQDEPGATDLERAITRYTYARNGQVLSVTDPTGARVESTYDDLDRPVTSTQVERFPVADNLTSRFTYNDMGKVTALTSPSGAVTQSAYDTLGQLIRVTDPNNVVTQFGYDYSGRRIRLTDGLGRTERTDFDAVGRLSTESDLDPTTLAALRSQSYEYDLAGNLTRATPATGNPRSYSYDALNRLTQQVEPVSSTSSITTSFGYDAAGNKTRYTDGRGNVSTFTVNSLGLPESVIEPATTAQPALTDRTWTAVYDAAGNVVTMKAPGGVSRTRNYDASNRLVTESGTGAETSTATRTFGYDLGGRVVSVNSPGTTTPNTFSYNDRDQLLSATGPAGNASYGYDADGQMIARSDAAGAATFGYTKGRLTTVKDGITGSTQTLGYDTAGAISTVDYGSGRVRTFGYDPLGRTTGDTLKNAAGAVVESVAYGYDNDDRITSKTTTGVAGAAANTYGYDFAGRLTSWTKGGVTTAYTWDASGNRLSAGTVSATFDQRNRLLTSGSTSYTYTPRGTIASKTTAGVAEAFTFDAFDRLISDGARSYTYDGFDRAATATGSTFTYAGMGDDPVSDGTQKFARGPDDELIAMSQGTTQRLTLTDLHGDVIGGFSPTDTVLGSLPDSRTYDPFGTVTATSGQKNDLGFQGDWSDPVTGQVDMGARWYDPSTGTFDSRDSQGYSSGASVLANRYTYGADDPVTQSDPDGHWPSCGWCHKAWNSFTSSVSSGWHATTSAFHSAWSYVPSFIRSPISSAWSALKWTYHNVVAPAVSFVYHASGISHVVQGVRSAFRWAGAHLSPAAVGRWSVNKLIQARAAAHAFKARVTRQAKAAVAYAVRHNPIAKLAAAIKPIAAQAKVMLAALPKMKAALVAVTRDVLKDSLVAVNAVYQKAVSAAGPVIQQLSNAATSVTEFAKAAAPTIAGIAAGALTTGACLFATGGAGSAACVVAGFAVGSAVTSALSCPPGRSLAGCAARGAAVGVVSGALTVATGGLGAGAAGFVGQVAGRAAAGAITSAGANATEQLLDTGHIDAGQLAQQTAVGGVLGGATSRIGGAKLCNSFTADTPVRMANGASKPIKDVKVGDKVAAGDPKTGRVEPEKVTHLIRHAGHHGMVLLTLSDGSVIRATDQHPFWDAGSRTFVFAEDLSVGSRLATATGATLTVSAITLFAADLKAYNLTVDELHTYFAGSASILVHNTGSDRCDVPTPGAGGSAAASKQALKKFPEVDHLRGADPEDVLDVIPDHWTVSTPSSVPEGGDGIRFANPKAPGQAIIYEEGWPGHPDPTHRGPYLRVSNGKQGAYRIPLAGNPALEGGG